MKRAWEIIRKNVKTSGTEILGYYDLKQHKPWFANTVQNYCIKGTGNT